MSVRRQCQLLGLNRSTFYYEAAAEALENLRLMRLLDQEYTAHPLPGQPPPDAVADPARGGSQPQAGPTTTAAHGSGGGLPQTPAEYRPAGAPGLPVLAAEREHRAARSGLEYGHHVCAAGLGLQVPGSHPRLVQPLRPGVAAVEHAGRFILPGNAGRGVEPRAGR